jgi:hypothetical protein
MTDNEPAGWQAPAAGVGLALDVAVGEGVCVGAGVGVGVTGMAVGVGVLVTIGTQVAQGSQPPLDSAVQLPMPISISSAVVLMQKSDEGLVISKARQKARVRRLATNNPGSRTPCKDSIGHIDVRNRNRPERQRRSPTFEGRRPSLDRPGPEHWGHR